MKKELQKKFLASRNKVTMKLDFYVVPLILVDTLNAVEGAGLNVRPTNEQLQLNSKQTQSIWRI